MQTPSYSEYRTWGSVACDFCGRGTDYSRKEKLAWDASGNREVEPAVSDTSGFPDWITTFTFSVTEAHPHFGLSKHILSADVCDDCTGRTIADLVSAVTAAAEAERAERKAKADAS